MIHTAREADARAREIRAELQVVVHDLSATTNAARTERQRLDEIGGEVDFLREQIEAADAEITAVAERLADLERTWRGMRKEEELLDQGLTALDETVAVARERLMSLGPAAAEPVPELPPMPQPPVSARVAVETLRRDRSANEQRLAALRPSATSSPPTTR